MAALHVVLRVAQSRKRSPRSIVVKVPNFDEIGDWRSWRFQGI